MSSASLHLVEAQLLGLLAKYEEHSIDYVGLSRTIWSNDGGKPLVKRPDFALATIALEIFEHHLGDEQARRVLTPREHIGRTRRTRRTKRKAN